ncbi:Ubiquitin carboxyl-terminal hydrolase 29 [Geranomyces michiganensis]|nr:Ubiquitin carboxyl-terminal hydrolase 29 [Geranomyces michiganensis]
MIRQGAGTSANGGGGAASSPSAPAGSSRFKIASFGRPVRQQEVQTTLRLVKRESQDQDVLRAAAAVPPPKTANKEKTNNLTQMVEQENGVKISQLAKAPSALAPAFESAPSIADATAIARADPPQELPLKASNGQFLPPPATDAMIDTAAERHPHPVPLPIEATANADSPNSTTHSNAPTPSKPAGEPTALRSTPSPDPFIEPDPSSRSRSPVKTYGSGGYPIKRPGSLLPEQRHTKYRLDRSPPRSEGIRNLGQTCYMAASLQMLYSLPFTTNFQAIVASLERKGLGGGTLWACISQIFKLRDNCKLVSVLPLRKTLNDLIQQFNDNRQEDAQEFLTAILSLLKNELRSVQVPRGRAPIASFFEWTAERTLECRACHNTSHGSEPFDTMPLDLPAQMGRRTSLNTLVWSFFKGGSVDWKCTKCGATNASKSYCMRDHPPVVIVHLKRFWLDAKVMAIRKRNDPVEIPLVLDLGRWQKSESRGLSESNAVRAPFTSPAHSNPAARQTNDSKRAIAKVRGRYRLRSIVSHLGNKPFRGHYVADVYDDNTELWTCFDDTNVTKGQRNVEQKRDRTVYLVAYVLDDGDGDDDDGGGGGRV